MKIAQFKHVKLSFVRILTEETANDLEKYSPGENAQLSQWVEMEFPPLPASEVIAAELSSLEQIKAEVIANYTRQLADIDRRKAELLALPNLEAA